MQPRKILVAGSTGSCGRAMLRLAAAQGLSASVIPHLRPKARDTAPPAGAVVLDLADETALAQALAGFTTVVQLIGTVRKRFAKGDTYESSDIGTTRQLVAAARRAGTVDHLVLLSSVGAGSSPGAYMRAKAEAERIVRESGIAYTVFRPSMFYGEGHRSVPGAKWLLRAVGARKIEPIAVDELVAAMLRTAMTRAPLGVALEGKSLWDVVETAGGRHA